MSGHSKWSKVKHQKATSDARKGQVFSKLSKLITVAAKKGSTVDMNPDLKYVIGKAKEANMPMDKIEKAIQKGAGGGQEENLEEVLYELFGPGGTAILVECVTDNKNRTLNELKNILSKQEAKIGTPGSAAWAFEKSTETRKWKPKHQVEIPESDKKKLKKLIESIEESEDVQMVYTNTS